MARLMTISELAYELYKENWKINHGITREKEQRELIQYYNEVKDGYEYDYRRYLSDYGYGSEVYACYEEFLEAEYKDKEFMFILFNEDTDLCYEYLCDLGLDGDYAKWTFNERYGLFECSNCNSGIASNVYPYCPWCGTPMYNRKPNEIKDEE